MYYIALCGLHNSKDKIQERVNKMIGGTAIVHSTTLYDDVDSLINSGKSFHVYFLNKQMRGHNEQKLLDYIERNSKAKPQDKVKGRKVFNFITFADDPISDDDCNTILESIRRYLDYDSMYLSVEFLTEKGMNSIAVSKILYFECIDRKIKIKTQTSEHLCEDTLKNV